MNVQGRYSLFVHSQFTCQATSENATQNIKMKICYQLGHGTLVIVGIVLTSVKSGLRYRRYSETA